MSERVQKLPRDNFAVRQHLKYVEMYSDETNYQALTYGDTVTVKEEVSPLIQPEEDEANAVRFDALMYRIELAYLMGKKDIKARGDLRKKVKGVAGVANIPEIQDRKDAMIRILKMMYCQSSGKKRNLRMTS